jgi:heme-degrading monooxygenase HmoA
MFAVIFRAKIKLLDEDYLDTAAKMRDLALNEYGCLEFTSSNEGENELAISYWPSKENIKAWKNNPEHQAAQQKGKQQWYRSYQVDIVEVLHSYGA